MRTLTLIAILAVAACSPGADRGADFCERADECNVLNFSVAECTEIEHRCIDSLTDSQRHDWEQLMDQCLELDSCDLFLQCWSQVPWC